MVLHLGGFPRHETLGYSGILFTVDASTSGLSSAARVECMDRSGSTEHVKNSVYKIGTEIL